MQFTTHFVIDEYKRTLCTAKINELDSEFVNNKAKIPI